MMIKYNKENDILYDVPFGVLDIGSVFIWKSNLMIKTKDDIGFVLAGKRDVGDVAYLQSTKVNLVLDTRGVFWNMLLPHIKDS
jgi:hypothetical protein